MYKQHLKEEPQNADALHLFGILLAQQEKMSDALDVIQKAVALDPQSPSYQNSLGNVLKHLDKLEEAIQHYKKALQLQPNYAVAHNSLGIIYYRQDKLKQAITHYRQALQSQPNYADAHYNLGIALTKQNELEEALAHFSETLKQEPNHLQAHMHKAQILHQQNKLSDALHHYQKRLKQDPHHAETNINVGAILVAQEKWDDAIKHFKQTIQTQPNNLEALHNLGATFLAKGEPVAALKYYLQLMRIAPDFDTHYNLGVIYMYQDHHKDAINAFENALRLQSNDIATHINLGATYLKKEDYKNAIKHYKIALNLQPDNEEIAYILKAISNEQGPTTAPTTYIQHLFDQYAPHFDKHLTDYLDYKAPELLYEAITEEIGTDKAEWNIIDLGCGTGLCGERFKPLAKKLIGIDLSEKMIAMAKQKAIYDECLIEDIQTALTQYKNIDLILAADTLVYIGDLTTLFKHAQQALKKQALFAFTIEKTTEPNYTLQKSARFAHNPKTITTLANQHHFNIIRCNNIITRKQHNQPVEGYLYVLSSE